ncbi:predicted protein [Uncinocarpus reesii 1704]|uniref:Uncharacterized protein n=1 Tax=Uncinocarpus reesii (strain UAMH 1704) TaxID=336963 RepID=C4JUC1_UNCRE|nr:uncharacterized protein UREG_06060 [Uncinocarpus reesii 1704]EEP81218.1 predicted protein [Uncinocarpus reesii 1704]
MTWQASALGRICHRCFVAKDLLSNQAEQKKRRNNGIRLDLRASQAQAAAQHPDLATPNRPDPVVQSRRGKCDRPRSRDDSRVSTGFTIIIL